jgi:hypothetical protein
LLVFSFPGAVSGGDGASVGGLVGQAFGSPAGSIVRSYATGTVSGGLGSRNGGLIGNNSGFQSRNLSLRDALLVVRTA